MIEEEERYVDAKTGVELWKRPILETKEATQCIDWEHRASQLKTDESRCPYIRKEKSIETDERSKVETEAGSKELASWRWFKRKYNERGRGGQEEDDK